MPQATTAAASGRDDGGAGRAPGPGLRKARAVPVRLPSNRSDGGGGAPPLSRPGGPVQATSVSVEAKNIAWLTAERICSSV